MSPFQIQPQSKEQKEPYIAQIESFWGSYIGTMKTRSAGSGSKTQLGYLCCRWFYRPSDTGFPCMGSGNELYLSELIDHEVPVSHLVHLPGIIVFGLTLGFPSLDFVSSLFGKGRNP